MFRKFRAVVAITTITLMSGSAFAGPLSADGFPFPLTPNQCYKDLTTGAEILQVTKGEFEYTFKRLNGDIEVVIKTAADGLWMNTPGTQIVSVCNKTTTDVELYVIQFK